jgi:hypothetical protein
MNTSLTLSVSKKGLAELLHEVHGLTVPHYQRKYCWEEVHCESLLRDIQAVAFHGVTTHYFGTITLSALANGQWYIVDGQQRMSTVSLFLHALSQHITDAGVKSMLEECLHTGPLLKLAFEDPTDQKTWRHLVLDRFCDEESINRAMVGNHAFFAAQLAKKDPAAWADAVQEGRLLQRLLFVQVDLPSSLAPQRIFERMNATRLEINQMDLIKNYLLYCAGADEEQAVYQLWEERFHGCLWIFELIIETKAAAEVPENRLYKMFRQLHHSLSHQPHAVRGFLLDLETVTARYHEASKTFESFTGGPQHGFSWRYRWLLMKASMVYTAPDERPQRDQALAQLAGYLMTWIAAERLPVNRMHKRSEDANSCFKWLDEISAAGNTAAAFTAVLGKHCQPESREAVRAGIEGWLSLSTPRPTANAQIVFGHEMVGGSASQSAEQLEEAFWRLLEKRRRPGSDDA